VLSSTKIKYLGVVGTLAIISTSYVLHAKTFYTQLHEVVKSDNIVEKVQKQVVTEPKIETRVTHVEKKPSLTVEQHIIVEKPKAATLTTSEKLEKLLKEYKYIHVEKSGEISKNSKDALDEIIPLLSDINNSYIEIEGYSASQMYGYLTQQISKKFAQSVYNYLNEKKIDCKIVITGYGDLYPIIDDKKDERNSRVELKVRRR
jgi:outer membrane protein OmpA-like peptidoglycan-associated protein